MYCKFYCGLFPRFECAWNPSLTTPWFGGLGFRVSVFSGFWVYRQGLGFRVFLFFVQDLGCKGTV